ncbi:MAG: phage minor head protein [Desulfuromonas thiophila]|nr:phage minor head protein [Desulfuromonas thiophila]
MLSCGSTRPSHAAQHGKVYRHDHPYWDTWYPPNGFRCRCSVRTLSDRQLQSRGLTPETDDPTGKLIEPVDPVTGGKMPARLMMPDKGFGLNPGKTWREFDQVVWQQASTWPEAFRNAIITSMAGAELRQQVYEQTIKELMARRQATGQLIPVGWVRPEIMAALEARGIGLETPLIAMTDKQALHALRDSKAAKLTEADFLRIPEIIRNPEAVILHKNRLLYVVTREIDGRKNKIVVEINRRVKKQGTVNAFVTAGVVERANLASEDHTLIWGGL